MPTFSPLVRTAFFMAYELEITNYIIRRNGAHTKHMKEMEQYLICHCSPTLASIKTANLFSCSFERQEDFAECIAYWNKQMHPKGIAVTVLQQKPNWALVYVHRIAQLQKDLQKPGVSCFLEQYGYVDLCVEKALEPKSCRYSCGTALWCWECIVSIWMYWKRTPLPLSVTRRQDSE